MQQQDFETVYRRARHAVTWLRLKPNDTELRRLVTLSINKGDPLTSEAVINQHVARIVVHLAKGMGVRLESEQVRDAVREAARAAQGETTTRLPEPTRRPPPSPDENALATFISYTGGGTQPISEAQYRELQTMMAQVQVGMASNEIERQELLRQWEQYQRRFQRSQARGRAWGCLGRLIAVPGCLGIGLIYLLLSTGVIGVALAGLAAFFISRGGDLSTFLEGLQQMASRLIAENLLGQAQQPGVGTGTLPLPPAPDAGFADAITGLVLPGGLTALAAGLAVMALVRRAVKSVVGVLLLGVMVALVGAGAFWVARSDAVNTFIQQMLASGS